MRNQSLPRTRAETALAAAGAVICAGLAVWLLRPAASAALGALLVAAVWEEALFRGMLQGALLHRLSLRTRWLGLSGANVLASALFCLAHLYLHAAILLPGVFVASLALGALRERTEGLAWPIVAHAGLNLAWWGVLQPLSSNLRTA